MDEIKFRICDKNVTDTFTEFINNQQQSLKCENMNIPLQVVDSYENIVKFELPRKYDALISLNSINNLEFVKSINLILTGIRYEEKFKLYFGRKINLPIFMIPWYHAILEVEYVDKKYITDNFILNCDYAYVIPSIRGNLNIGREYLKHFVALTKK